MVSQTGSLSCYVYLRPERPFFLELDFFLDFFFTDSFFGGATSFGWAVTASGAGDMDVPGPIITGPGPVGTSGTGSGGGVGKGVETGSGGGVYNPGVGATRGVTDVHAPAKAVKTPKAKLLISILFFIFDMR